MSKQVLAVICVVLGIASASFAEGVEEPTASFTVGGLVDPYSGPTPSGMRFGDGAHVVAMQTASIEGDELPVGCPQCRFGIHGVPCDPDWRGPCIDWKVIGWYSNFHDKNELWCEKGHGCGRCGRCCGCQSCCY